ncbi:DUF4145 domain-containing protein [Lysinibacillus endophyticus]|uniref:DUF4145 domain-containing protein n=1 Tax=Ureibacillus endophyticus TaxID=1978490 RepID=UPI00209C6F9C|nr:DUF4145 domain-containing protein [Lysinibacillus endophyticus]MCP1144878.1 DUF4145 domain-containing protein [Lysinibacillus endophyticus]
MKSSIFKFLGDYSSTLKELVLRFEDLLWDQPQAAMMNARLFGETLVNMIFEQENMNEVYPLKQWEKTNRLYNHDIIPDDIYKKFEYIRKNGNTAVHQPTEMDIEVAKQAHQFIFDLGVWYVEVYGSYKFNAPDYELPAKQIQEPHFIQEWMKEHQKKIAEIEKQLEELKQEKQQNTVKEVKKINTQKVPKHERIVPLDQYKETFKKANFDLKKTTKKTAEFKHMEFGEKDDEAYVYLLDNVTPTIVVHPTLIAKAPQLEEMASEPLKHTGLTKFPRKIEDNTKKSNYGHPFTFQTNGELEAILIRIGEVLNSRYH